MIRMLGSWVAAGLLALSLGTDGLTVSGVSAMQPADILTLKSVSIAALDSTGARLLYTVRAWNAETQRREAPVDSTAGDEFPRNE